MKTIRIVPLAALLSFAAACADAVTEPAATPAEPSAVAVPPLACVKFGPMPPAGTIWGAPNGNIPGDVVLTESTIDVSVERFLAGGVIFFGGARLEPAALIGWGWQNSVHLMDLNLRYHFMAAGGWVLSQVQFNYLDLGGVENLAVNGALYVGNLAGAPAVLGGANVVVGAGAVTITGAVTDLVVGGQNLRVDNVCAAP